MDILDIISTKRDRQQHTPQQIDFLIEQVLKPETPSYQLSAWLMAAYLNGLNFDETTWLTQSIANHGAKLDLSVLEGPSVDKHSTGGVGDKVTLIVLPMLASLGMNVVKMSGRALGITGGTCDKLEGVPGFTIQLSPEKMLEIAKKIKIGWTGHSIDLAPADKVLYALRDVTCTISSIPLITASILSKKLAAGAKNIIMDVKCGSGAFMHNFDEAKALADSLVAVGDRSGVKVSTVISDMDQPLGRAVGNNLELIEMIQVLQGKSQPRLMELCNHICAMALVSCGIESDFETAKQKSQQSIDSGKALEKAQEWFATQGADPKLFEQNQPDLATAPVVKTICYSGETGFVSQWDARIVGEVALELGGGRKKKEDNIDHRVGIVSHIEVGQKLEPGQTLYKIHAADQASADLAEENLKQALKISENFVAPAKVILDTSKL
jgi:pyrimidine-nucleoside phosphorylase